MRELKINLKKLAKLKIIQLVEPSENLKNSYLEKSKSSLISSRILFQNNQNSDAIALTYFSMYNSLLALLFFVGIKSENHNASIFLLREVFGIDNKTILEAKIERKEQQYYPSFSKTSAEVKNAIFSTEEFNAKIKDFIEKLSRKDIEIYRKRFLDLIK